MAGIGGLGNSGVERRPEHPQEDGSDHGVDVRMIDGALVFVFALAGAGERLRASQAEVGSEGVHNDRASDVIHMEGVHDVMLHEDGDRSLDQGHDEVLNR